jgi:hypothetical protein
MLKISGYINIAIAILHVLGLFWAERMFEVTGIGNEMKELSLIHPILPYFLTVLVAIAFFVFGLYGLSADNKFRKLPFLKPIIFTISGIYIFRGIGEIIFDTINKTNSLIEIIYSLAALMIGIMMLIGGRKKWYFLKSKN